MDQRLHFLALLFIGSSVVGSIAQSQEVHIEPPVVVEATPINIFSERANGWNYSEQTSDELHAEALNSYESLGSIPGLASGSESPRLSIRGSSSLARILGLYDGVPINSPDGFGFSSLLVPNENLGEVKIIRGPASIFWGKDALGGAINHLPRIRNRYAVKLHAGSFDRKGFALAAPLIKPSESGHLQVTGYSDSTNGEFPYQSTTTALSGDRKSNNRHLQRATLNALQVGEKWSLSENLIFAQEFNSTPGSIYSPMITRANRQAGMGSLSAGFSLDPTWDFHYRIFAVMNDSKFETTSSFAPDVSLSNSKSSRLGNSLSGRKIFSNNFEIEIFADHFHDSFEASYVLDKRFQADEFEFGMIADYGLNNHLIIKPGLRYLAAHKTLVPALGFFEEHQGFSRWLSYTHGIRVPDLAQKYADTPDFVGNPDLKPEISEQVEIGFKQKNLVDPAKKWNFYSYGITIFSTNYKDLLVYEGSVIPNTYSNIGKANAQGFEGFAEYQDDIWGIDGQLAYTKSEDSLKRPLPFAPEVQALIKEHYSWAILTFELEHSIWGKYYENNSERIGWVMTDFHIRTFGLNDWDIKLSAFNLFDTPREISVGFPEPQRKLWLSVERHF